MKHYISVVAGILLFLAALAGLLAVVNHFTRPVSTVLTSADCEPPCWYGIRPGETTSAQVLGVLTSQPWVSAGSIREWTREDEVTHVAWMFQRPAGDAFGYVYYDDDRCTAISILTYGALRVADAFGRLGTPDSVWTHTDSAGGREWVAVTLLYPAGGFAVEVAFDLPAGSERDYVEIHEKSPVDRVTYFDPDQFEDLLETEILINQPVAKRTGELRPWPGLGRIPFEGRQIMDVITVSIQHLWLSLLPWAAATLVGGGLGVLFAFAARPLLANHRMRLIGGLLPWRALAMTLAMLALIAPWSVHYFGIRLRLGAGSAQLSLAVALFVLALPFTAHTLFEQWFPTTLAARLINLARSLGVLAIGAAVMGHFLGAGGAGRVIVEAGNLLDYPRVFQGAGVVLLLASLFDVLLGAVVMWWSGFARKTHSAAMAQAAAARA